MKSTKFILSVLLLFVVSVACNLPVNSLLGFKATPTAPIIEPALEPFVVATTESNEVIITITEAQLNTILTEKLSANPDSILQQPSVTIGNDRVILHGKTIQSNIEVNMTVEMSVAINSEGTPDITVESAKIGPLAAPQFLKDSLNTLADEMLTGAIGPIITGARVERITIEQGYMVITIK